MKVQIFIVSFKPGAFAFVGGPGEMGDLKAHLKAISEQNLMPR